MRVENEVDVWFGADDRLFLGIFELLERAGGVPAGHPGFRPHEHAVGPGRGDRDARRRIGNGLPEAVGHQIGRAHLADKLGIQAPAAMVGEALGLDEHRGGRCRTGCHQQPDQDKKRGP